jgi:hypothetical protein
MAPRGSPEDPKVTALRESRCLNPHPEQVTDETFGAVLRRPRRRAGQIRDGAPRPRGRRTGHRDRVRVLPAVVLPAITSAGWSRRVKIRAVRVAAGGGRYRVTAGVHAARRTAGVGQWVRAARDAGGPWVTNPSNQPGAGVLT